jgi:TRAP-type C4-dicarboxylate transport system permease large subunit
MTQAMLSISTHPYVLLFLVNVLLVIVGMFLDSTTAILVIAPSDLPSTTVRGNTIGRNN